MSEERFNNAPDSLKRTVLNIEGMEKARLLAATATDETTREMYILAVKYWKDNIIRSACKAFRKDNTLKFADLDELAGTDPDIIECFRIALREGEGE